jgi:HSP20 family protein
MAYNYQQVPFWDFVRGFDQNGAGVDHPAPEAHPFFGPPPHGGPAPFPFGFGPGMHGPGFPHGGPFGGRGGGGGCRRGRHGRHNRDGEEEARASGAEGEHTEEEGEAREAEENNDGPTEGFRGRRGFHGRGGHGGRGRGGWAHAHHGHHGPHGRRGPPPSFGGQGGMGAFDLRPIFEALSNHPIGQHPWAQAFRNYAEQAGFAGDAQRSGETLVPDDADIENSFVPPVDVFSTETAYILHIALPGAKKEDVGVNWDSDKGVLNLAGVVYRQGDEEFLKKMTKSERKVGVFERSVKLPPGEEEKEEVDSDAITAKLEDGILIVTVPKVEKEWTEVKKVDIQ